MKLDHSTNLLQKVFLAINITYIFVILFIDFLLPPNGFVSISNILLPIILLGQIFFFFQHKYFRIFGIIVSIWSIYKLIVNYIYPPLTFQELTEIFRLFKLLAIVFSVFYIHQYSHIVVSRLIVVSFIFQVVIVAFQLIGIDYFINAYVLRPELIDLHRYGLTDVRVSGVFLNPNDLGFFNLLVALYFYFSANQSRYFLLSLALLVVFMSQSRTIFITLLVVILILSISNYFKNKKIKFNPKPAILILSLIIVFSLLLPNTQSLIDGSAFKSHSFLARFEIIGNTIELNKSSMLIGQGYVNDIPKIVGGAIDNEYALIYLQYGLIGLLLLFATLIFSLRLIKSFPNKLFFYTSLVVFLIVGFTNLSFSNFEVIPYFLIVAVLIALTHHKQSKTKE
jgi:hypothetical protein